MSPKSMTPVTPAIVHEEVVESQVVVDDLCAERGKRRKDAVRTRSRTRSRSAAAVRVGDQVRVRHERRQVLLVPLDGSAGGGVEEAAQGGLRGAR